eukprot:scaffold37722_cov26-Tisochrysis_lutea.AAC.3
MASSSVAYRPAAMGRETSSCAAHLAGESSRPETQQTHRPEGRRRKERRKARDHRALRVVSLLTRPIRPPALARGMKTGGA